MKKKVIIIGSGMAGLSAGCYLRMNGYETDLFEMQDVPGGVCTSWRRGEYTVDFCLHWLVGSGSANSFYNRWSELIDMEHIQFIDHEEYARVEDEQGRCIRLFTNVDRLEAELLQKAPEDKPEILRFTEAIRKLTTLDLPSEKAEELANLWDRMKTAWKMLPYLGLFGKYMRLSNKEYAQRFKNPLLRKAITNLFEPEMTLIFSMMTLAWMHTQSAGYPIGGSMRFALKVAHRYQRLGGRINFHSRVDKILVEDNRAVGIQLADGSQHFADYVISAADGHSTIFKMLEGKYSNPELLKAFESRPTFPSLVFVALGVGRSFEGEPHSLLFPLCAPFRVDSQTTIDDLYLRIHNFDPSLAPEGKTLLTVMIETYDHRFWQRLYEESPEQYQAEKERIAETVIHALEHRLGNIQAHLEMTDVATPATFIHYTNNWKGSFEGWLITPESGMQPIPHQLEGLDHFYLCGHWVAVGGGLPTVLLSGRDVAQLICHNDGQPFVVTPPVGDEVREKSKVIH
ncbi:MAG: NAD(P)/FAD-dependent oxidoreductase [Lewinellaceae bacterium]|nr:NAD(P)/FAD-dependent oxidoreductase [Phaeodactylibacter sp.]MCB9351815.1 NAD(P)/FAD-dependent oxidoreductase [Lewinellaceae bacterium]